MDEYCVANPKTVGCSRLSKDSSSDKMLKFQKEREEEHLKHLEEKFKDKFPSGYDQLTTVEEKLSALKELIKKEREEKKKELEKEKVEKKKALELRFATEIAAISSWSALQNKTRMHELHYLKNQENKTKTETDCREANHLPADYSSLSEKEQREALFKCKKALKKAQKETEFAGQLPADYTTLDEKARYHTLKLLSMEAKKKELETELNDLLPDDYATKSKCEQWEALQTLKKQHKKTELENSFAAQLPEGYSELSERQQWSELRKLQAAKKKKDLESEFSATNPDPELRLPAEYTTLDVKEQWEVLHKLSDLKKYKALEQHYREKGTLPVKGYSECSEEGQWMELLHLVYKSLKPLLEKAFAPEIKEKVPDYTTYAEKKQFSVLTRIAQSKLREIKKPSEEEWGKMTDEEKEQWKRGNLPAWFEDFELVGKLHKGGRGHKGDKSGDKSGKHGGKSGKGKGKGDDQSEGAEKAGAMREQKGGRSSNRGNNRGDKEHKSGSKSSSGGNTEKKRKFKRVKQSFKIPMENTEDPAEMPSNERSAFLAGLQKGIGDTLDVAEDAVEITRVAVVDTFTMRSLRFLQKGRGQKGRGKKTLEVDYEVDFSKDDPRMTGKTDEEIKRDWESFRNSDKFTENLDKSLQAEYQKQGMGGDQTPGTGGKPEWGNMDIEDREEDDFEPTFGNSNGYEQGPTMLSRQREESPRQRPLEDIVASSATGVQVSLLSTVVVCVVGMMI